MTLTTPDMELVLGLITFAWQNGGFRTEDAGINAALLRRRIAQTLKPAEPTKMELVDKPPAVAQ